MGKKILILERAPYNEQSNSQKVIQLILRHGFKNNFANTFEYFRRKKNTFYLTMPTLLFLLNGRIYHPWK